MLHVGGLKLKVFFSTTKFNFSLIYLISGLAFDVESRAPFLFTVVQGKRLAPEAFSMYR